jgi:hypothetical protein
MCEFLCRLYRNFIGKARSFWKQKEQHLFLGSHYMKICVFHLNKKKKPFGLVTKLCALIGTRCSFLLGFKEKPIRYFLCGLCIGVKPLYDPVLFGNKKKNT